MVKRLRVSLAMRLSRDLRGEKGSVVRLGIRRQNVVGIVHYDVVRDKITLNSARGGFMIEPETGYVRLTEFSATTYLEMMDKLATLESSGNAEIGP